MSNVIRLNFKRLPYGALRFSDRTAIINAVKFCYRHNYQIHYGTDAVYAIPRWKRGIEA
jgi:hypothetical protein